MQLLNKGVEIGGKAVNVGVTAVETGTEKAVNLVSDGIDVVENGVKDAVMVTAFTTIPVLSNVTEHPFIGFCFKSVALCVWFVALAFSLFTGDLEEVCKSRQFFVSGKD